MKITLGVGFRSFVEKGINASANDVKATSTLYALHITRELIKRGIDVGFYTLGRNTRDDGAILNNEEIEEKYYLENPPEKCDHFISLEQSGFQCRTPKLLDVVRKNCTGIVATIKDHDLGMGDEDLLFHARVGVSGLDKAIHVGWGADHEFFYPEKDDKIFSIFIDHKYYYEKKYDKTEQIIFEICDFFKSFNPLNLPGSKEKVEIVFLGPTGIELIDPLNPPKYSFDADRSKYTKRIPMSELVHWYRRADVFVVTHSESMGLPILESAMSGALILAPQNFIKADLLRPLSHIEYEDSIPWNKVFKSIDVSAARERALGFRWSTVVDKMLQAISLFSSDSAKKSHPISKIELLMDHIVIRSKPVDDSMSTLSNLMLWDTEKTIIEKSTLKNSIYEQYVFKSKNDSGYHYIQYKLNKPPIQKLYSLSFFIKKESAGTLKVSLFGARHQDRSWVIFDFKGLSTIKSSSTWYWELFSKNIVSVDEHTFWCFLSAKSDYAPSLGMMIQVLDENGEGIYSDKEFLMCIYGVRLEEGAKPLCLDI